MTSPPRISLRADIDALRALARRKMAIAGAAAVVALAISTAILVIEYRLMIFAFVAMTIPLVGAIDAWRAWTAVSDGVVEARLEDRTLLVSTGRDRRTFPLETALLATSPDGMIIVLPREPGRYVRFVIPASPDAVAAFAEALRAEGARVSSEPGLGGLVAFFAGLIVMKGLIPLAAVLVLVALANAALAITGSGGSWPAAAWLTLGALAVLVVASLLTYAARPVR